MYARSETPVPIQLIKWVNKLMGGSIYILAGKRLQLAISALNVLHHNLHQYTRALMKIWKQEDFAGPNMPSGTKFHLKFSIFIPFSFMDFLPLTAAITTDSRTNAMRYTERKLPMENSPIHP